MHYSPSCSAWQNSVIGQRMSCLLVCETISHPEHVVTGTKSIFEFERFDFNKMMTCLVFLGLDNKHSSSVPEKYFIVKNNDYVRVKYILVYAEKLTKQR